MKKLLEVTKKYRVAIISLLSFIALVLPCWEFYKNQRIKNVAGAWKLTFINETSAKRSYIGDIYTQKLFISQKGNEITGIGEKWEYNGKLLPSSQHRKVEYSGTIEEDVLTATFKLYGLLRESSGSIQLEISDDGKMASGRFTASAADTKGPVTGVRLE